MINLSASSLWRAELCAPSAVIPPAARIHEDAQAGTAEHAELETKAPEGWRPEVAYDYDPETGAARELGQGINRDYTSAKGIPGTTDLMRAEPELARIKDYKTGFGYMVARPRENLQLLHNGLSAAAVAGVDQVFLEIEHTETGEIEEARLDGFDLALARERIRRVWRAVQDAEKRQANGEHLRVTEGDHCWRCEAFARCPAKLSLALTVSEGKLAQDLPTLDLTPEAVARGWPILQKAKKLLGEVEKIYRGYASGQRVHLGGRTFLGPRDKPPEKIINGQTTLKVLTEIYGEERAQLAVEISTSRAAIERALGPIAPKRGKTKLVDDAIEAIEKAGGVAKFPRAPVVEEFEEKSK